MGITKTISDTYTHCAYCEKEFSSRRERTRDHFIPLSRGGSKSAQNIFIVCGPCNSLKAHLFPDEFIDKLQGFIAMKVGIGSRGIGYPHSLLPVIVKNITAIIEIGLTHTYFKTAPENQSKIGKLPKEHVSVSGIHYVNYLGKECPCVGYIDRAIGYGVKQYQNVYYHDTEEKYIFFVHDTLIAYNKNTVHEFVKPFYPQKKSGETLKVVPPKLKEYPKNRDDMVSRLLSEPEQNFHCA